MEAAAKENVPPAAVPPLEHETSLSSPPPNYRARRRASVRLAKLASTVPCSNFLSPVSSPRLLRADGRNKCASR